MKLGELVEEFLLYLSAVRCLSENTVLGYKNDLEQLKKFLTPVLEINTITKENLLLCIGELSRQHKTGTTINRFIAAIRTMFAYAAKNGYIEKNPALEIKTVKISVKAPNFMTLREVDKICKEPLENEILWKTRDRAIFTMLYSSGCRISEMTNLTLDDFADNFHAAFVNGKGNKDRKVYFAEEARQALAEYLRDRKKVLLENNVQNPTKQLFINQKGEPITVGGMRYILNRYSGKEGINHHINPHAFRHSFATTMLNNGADVRMVKEMLGHSSISTTQRYTHVTREQLAKVYEEAFPHSKK